MELLLLAALGLGAVGYTLWPVIAGHRMRPGPSRTDTPLGRQELRKDLILGNIADLDFEYAMGKLSEADYRELREALKAQAAAVMEQIDVLRSDVAGPMAQAALAVGTSAAVANGESGSPGGNGHQADSSSAAGAVVVSFCKACGGKLPLQARFCPYCGEQVTA